MHKELKKKKRKKSKRMDVNGHKCKVLLSIPSSGSGIF